MFNNPFQEFLNHQKFQNDIQKAQKRFALKPFAVKFKLLKQLSIVGRYTLPSLSILAGITFVALRLKPLVNLWEVAIAFALILLILWETVKSELIRISFESFYQKSKTVLGLFLMTLTFTGVSIYVSVQGAGELYQLADQSKEQLHHQYLIEKNSISSAYQESIHVINTKIAGIEKHKTKRWGGLLSGSENQQILNYQEQIDKLQLAEQEAVSQLTLSYQANLQNLNQNQHFNTKAIYAIAALIDLLIVLAGWFCVFFDFKIIQELQICMQDQEPIELQTHDLSRMAEFFRYYYANQQKLLNQKDIDLPSIGFKPKTNPGNQENSSKNKNLHHNSVEDKLIRLIDLIRNGERDMRILTAVGFNPKQVKSYVERYG